MKSFFECHRTVVVITPSLVINNGECEKPDCEAMHFCLTLSWLIWTVGLQFSL